MSTVVARVATVRPRLTMAALAVMAAAITLVAAHDALVTGLGRLDVTSPSIDLGSVSIPAFRVYGPFLTLGAITGMTYGLLAAGLVLVYRASGIVNFAHGQIGAFGAVAFGLLVTQSGVPYWAAFPVAIVVGALVGAGSEMAVIRRLRNAPRLMSVVATLGLGQVLVLVATVISVGSGSLSFPEPPGIPSFFVGRFLVQPSYTAMLILTPCLVTGLALFLRFTRAGLAIRGSAANPDTARMIGVPVEGMATLTWAIAGAVAAFTALLFLPSHTGGVGGVSSIFDPGLILRALLPAVIARMSSLPVTLLAGLGVGIVEQEVLLNFHANGSDLVQVVLFVVILVVLMLQPRTSGRGEAKGSWVAMEAWAPLSEAVRRIWVVRNLGRILGCASLLVAVVVPLWLSDDTALPLTVLIAFIIVGLALGIVTGLGGEVSLGHFGLAGLGALAAVITVAHTGNFLLGFLAAGALAAVSSLVIALPALRIRGLFLAVTTLAFALAVPWVLEQPWAFSSGVEPGHPQVGSWLIDVGRPYYYFGLAVLVVCFFIAHRAWTGGFRRVLVATRDNEDAARAFTINATVVKLQAFVLSGFIAGLGGAMLAFSRSAVLPALYPVNDSIRALAVTVVGGAGVLAGPVAGALYVVGLPLVRILDATAVAATAIGWLALILQHPGGAAQALRGTRDRLVAWLAVHSGAPQAEVAEEPAARPAVVVPLHVRDSARAEAGERQVLLAAHGLVRSFGGVRAVQGVDLAVRDGETLGLIGPNGAGKTTTFELLSGFTRPDSGRVVFAGRDITGLGPEARGRLGLIRSFQDVALFPTMSVQETVMVALERRYRTRLLSTLVGEPRREQERAAVAREILASMGLERYRDTPARALSTGTRRIAELACLIALRPRLLLLDEPSSGIAQRETEALAQLIARVKRDLDATIIIIEHDMPLVMGLSDRVVAMEAGVVIADDVPEAIVKNPRVIESYLGDDVAPLERSDVVRLQPAMGV